MKNQIFDCNKNMPIHNSITSTLIVLEKNISFEYVLFVDMEIYIYTHLIALLCPFVLKK